MKKKQVSRILNKISKMTLSLLMVAMATLTFVVPIEIEAAGSKKAMMTWETAKEHLNPPEYTTNKAWEGSKLYWGNLDGNTSNPMKWRILNTKETGFGNTGMLIQGENLLGNTKFENSSVESGYNGSVLGGYIDGKYLSSLTSQEKSATQASSKTDEKYKIDFSLTAEGFKDSFSGKQWFAPTAKMMTTPSYGYPNGYRENDSRKFDSGVWFSSIATRYLNCAVSAEASGLLVIESIVNDEQTIAASVLNTNSILFVSKANGGKAVTGSELAPISESTSNEWKFTLKDSGQTMSDMKAKRTSLENVVITFDKSGQGTSLSAIVTDASGTNIMNYGRVSALASGSVNGATVTIKLPTGFDANGYKLKVFTEKYTNETSTDYASDLKDVSVPTVVNGVYAYRASDGSSKSENKTYDAGQKFADLEKPTLTDTVAGYRLSDSANPWIITPTTIDPTNIVDNFTATAQYTKTHKVKLYTGLDSSTTYFNGTVDDGRNLAEDGVAGSAPVGKDKVDLAPTPPAGYRFDKWEYSKLDGYDFDASKASVTNVGSNFVAKAKFTQQFKVNFKTHDGTLIETQIVDSGGNAVDPVTRVTSPIDKKQLERKNYHYSQWENFYNVREDKDIKPLYIPFDYKIDTKYDLYAFDESNSKSEFASLGNDEIDKKLKDIYKAILLRDGFEQDKSNYILSLTAINYEDIKAGKKGKYRIQFDYTNVDDSTFKASKVVTLKIADTESEDTGAKIAANDFTISTKEVSAVWFTNLIKLSSAQAFGSDGVEGKVKVEDFSKAKSVPGIYPITFSSEVQVGSATKKITTTVNVTVKDDSNVDEDAIEQINGNNFTLKQSDVNTIVADDAELIKLGQVCAYHLEQGSDLAVSVDDKSGLVAKVGKHTIRYTTAKGTLLTLVVEVVDKKEVNPNPAIKETISGNDFVLKTEQVKGLNDAQLKQLLIDVGNVKAVNTETYEPLEVVNVTHDVKAKSGDYDVTYTTAKNTSVTLVATVKDDTVIDKDKNEQISASDFVLETADVKKITDNALIAKAKASAKDIDTGAVVNITSVDKSNLLSKAGNYEVTFKTMKGTSITVIANVRDNVKEDVTNKEMITANDFVVKVKEVKNLTNEKLVVMANAEAKSIETDLNVPVSVKTSTIKGVAGVYRVLFTTVKGTEVEVKVSVVDDFVEDDTTKERIYASDFMVKVSEVDSLNDAIIKTKSNVQAFNIVTGVDVTFDDITVIGDVKANAGVYPVTFKTTNDTSITIAVSVVDETGTIPSPDVKESMSGNHFTMKLEDLKTIGNDKLITLGNVQAINTETGERVAVRVKTNKMKAVVGTYDVVYETTAGTTLTLKATIVDKMVEDSKTQEFMVANHFMIKTGEVATLTDSLVKTKANVKAVSLIDGKENTAIRVDHKILAKAGIYPVSFTTDKGTTISVMVSVVDEEDINRETNIKMSGNGFIVKSSDVKTLKADTAKLIELGNVKAKNMMDGSEYKVIVTLNGLQEKTGTYNVVFGLDKDNATIKSALTLAVEVVDDYVEDSETKETITASNATVLVEDVKTLDAKEILKRTGAKAFETDSKKAVDITKVTHTIKPIVGSYEVVLETDKGTKMSVLVSVKNQNKEDVISGETISGSNFLISVEEAKKVTDEEIMEFANVNAFVTNTGENVEVRVDRGKFKASQGVYDIVFNTEKNTSLTIQAEVKENVKIDKEKREKIWADDIYLGMSEVYRLDNEILKSLSNVKAINMDTNEMVEIVTVENNVKSEVGEYWATFATANETSIKIKVFVEKSVEENTKNEERMTGSSFKLDISEVDTITNDALISKGNIKALDRNTGMFVNVNVDRSALLSKEGTYPVVYTTEKGTSITILVQVVDRTQIKEEVIGNDIYLNLEESKNINNDILLLKSKARARDINSDRAVPIVKIEHTIKATKGIYEATFETEKGALLLVDVHVNNKANLETSLGQQITGNRFVLKPQEVSTLKDETILMLGNVKAIDLDTNEFVNVIIDKSQVEAREGVFDIGLTTSKGVSTTIQVEVKNEAPTIVVAEEPKVIVKKEVVYVKEDATTNEKNTKNNKNIKNNKQSTSTSLSQSGSKENSSFETITEEKMTYFAWGLVIVYAGYMIIRVLSKKRGE